MSPEPVWIDLAAEGRKCSRIQCYAWNSQPRCPLKNFFIRNLKFNHVPHESHAHFLLFFQFSSEHLRNKYAKYREFNQHVSNVRLRPSFRYTNCGKQLPFLCQRANSNANCVTSNVSYKQHGQRYYLETSLSRSKAFAGSLQL